MSPAGFIAIWQRRYGGDHASHGQDGTRRTGDRLSADFLPKTDDNTFVRCQCGEVLGLTGMELEELRPWQ